MDGTLVDSQHMICAAMQQAFLDHRIDCPPREKLLSIVGLSLVEALERVYGEAIAAGVSQLLAMAKAFTARRTGQLRERAQQIVDGLLDGIEAQGPPADLVDGLAEFLHEHGIVPVIT